MTRYKLKPKFITENIIPLNEITLLKDNSNNVTLEVDDESDRIGDWYFKFFTGTDYNSSDRVARIRFDTELYIVHPSDPRTWTISKKIIRKVLIPLLLKPFQTNNKNLNILMQLGINNWQAGMFIVNGYCCNWTIPLIKFKNLTRQSDWYKSKFIPIKEITFPNYINLHYN